MGAQAAIAADLDAAAPLQTDDPKPSDEAIRQRSQQIWESEGRPEGRSEEHWNRARAELAELLARTSNAHLAPRPRAEISEPIAPAPSPECVADGESSDGEVSDSSMEAVQDDVAPDISPSIGEAAAAGARPLRVPPARLSNPTVPCLISAGAHFQGTLESPGEIQFDGALEGTLCAVGVVVDENAFIHGDVIGDDVTVRGHVNGRISGRQVVLRAGCRVEGEIFYQALAVETGADADCRFQPMNAESSDAAQEDACETLYKA